MATRKLNKMAARKLNQIAARKLNKMVVRKIAARKKMAAGPQNKMMASKQINLAARQQNKMAARKLNLGRLLCIYLSGITSASAGCAITAAYGNRGGSRRRRSGHEIGMEGGLRRGGDVTTAG